MKAIATLLALVTLASSAVAEESGNRILLIRAYDNEAHGEEVYRFVTQEKCIENAAALTVKYRILGTEKTVYFFCRAPQANG